MTEVRKLTTIAGLGERSLEQRGYQEMLTAFTVEVGAKAALSMQEAIVTFAGQHGRWPVFCWVEIGAWDGQRISIDGFACDVAPVDPMIRVYRAGMLNGLVTSVDET